MTMLWKTNSLSSTVPRACRVALCMGALFTGAADAAPIMYVHDSQGRLATVDVANGAVSLIGNLGVTLTDIAFDPSGNLYGISFTGLFAINAATAQTTFIGSHGISGGNALVFGTDGTLYGAGNNSGSLFTINLASGNATSLGNMGFTSGGDLAFNAGNLYLASSGSQLVEVELGNLSATHAIGSFGVGGVFGLATGDNGLLYAVAGTTIYSVDIGTGAASNAQPYGGQGLGTAFGQSFFKEAGAGNVPEPGVSALVGLGLVGMFVARRRRSR